MPIRRPRTNHEQGLAVLRERAHAARVRAADVTPPWGTVGLGEADGCLLRAVVAEAMAGAILQGLDVAAARDAAEAVGREWIGRRVMAAVAEEADCARTAYEQATIAEVTNA